MHTIPLNSPCQSFSSESLVCLSDKGPSDSVEVKGQPATFPGVPDNLTLSLPKPQSYNLTTAIMAARDLLKVLHGVLKSNSLQWKWESNSWEIKNKIFDGKNPIHLFTHLKVTFCHCHYDKQTLASQESVTHYDTYQPRWFWSSSWYSRQLFQLQRISPCQSTHRTSHITRYTKY